MEDWIWIIFALIGFGIWLIVTVFRKAEEERQRNQMQQRRPEGGRRQGTDLDRFLDEARRRRGEVGPAPPRRAPEPQWAKPVPRPPRQPQAPPLQQPVARPPAFQPSVRRSASEQRPRASMATPPPQKQSLAPVVLELVPDDEPVTAQLAQQPSAPQTPPTQVPLTQVAGVLGARETRTLPPTVKQLQGMLGRPQSMATAFVLVEVFGPPVSRKWMK